MKDIKDLIKEDLDILNQELILLTEDVKTNISIKHWIDVAIERRYQERKHEGAQSHPIGWIAILTARLGKASDNVIKGNWFRRDGKTVSEVDASMQTYRDHLVDVAAVAMAALAAIDQEMGELTDENT